MSTDTITQLRPLNATIAEPAPPTVFDVTRRMLVSTDGSRAAAAALRVAAQLSARTGGSVSAVTVFESLPVHAMGFVLDAATWANDPVLTDSTVDRIKRQLRGAGGERWELHVEFGSATSEIVRLADVTEATLIVIGLGKHSPMARAFGAETTLRVIRHASVPVLAVDRRARALPHSAVVAADLGSGDLRLAQTALGVMSRPATLHLVHVRPELEIVPAHAAGWDRAYEETAREALEKVAARLRDSNVTVETHVVAGTVAQKITGFAYARRMGLIAAGRQSRSVVERLFIGSSATQIVRAADCSVLIVPPEESR